MEIDLVQGSQEWLDFRRTKRMASETAAIMGLSPWQKEKHILDAKRGINQKVNRAMQRGHELEPIAREAYEEIVGLLRPAVYVDGDYGASLDGIDIDESLIVEIKCPFQGKESKLWADAMDGRVPDHYLVQMQHQMMVVGVDLAHLWVFDGRDGIAVHVKRDDVMIANIRSAWDEFWRKNEL